MKNSIAVVAVAAALAIGGTSGAVASNLIDSGDVKNNSLRSADLMDGKAVGLKDLKPGVLRYIQSQAGQDGAPGQDGPAGAPGDSPNSVKTDWAPVDGAEIVDSHTVRLTSKGTPTGASVQIQDLNLPVEALKTIEFTYALEGGATYGAGSPRVFVEINGKYENTHDADPSDAGVPNDDGTFTKTYTIQNNGRVGAAGVVYDNPAGDGTITVSQLKISDRLISFN